MSVPMNRALQVRQILSARGLTLYRASRRSAEIFGRSSPYYLPHHLYYSLARHSAVPTICQILALSHITNYRFSDWLAVFGFDLDTLPRFAWMIPRPHTALLDSTVYDLQAWIPWFAERTRTGAIPPVAPLGQLLSKALSRRAKDLLDRNTRKFLYARVGSQDWYALPQLAPGSAIRVDPRLEGPAFFAGDHPGRFFLLEHDSGWTCSQLSPLAKDRVLLRCPPWPCAEREVRIGRDARILGAVDAEIRRLPLHHAEPAPPNRPPRQIPRFAQIAGAPASFTELLQSSRRNAGLSFREASSVSRRIADALSDEIYFAAPSTLSDYEVLSAPPRHIEKIITLCILYGLAFDRLLRATGLPLDQAGREPIPDELIPRTTTGPARAARLAGRDRAPQPNGFLAALLDQWEEIPLFLRGTLDEITGLQHFSFSDVFWVGGDTTQRHPLLRNATFIVINRRARKPSPSGEEVACGESLYLILKREGGYDCGRCTLEDGNLLLHGYPRGGAGAQRFRNGADAEVVGRVAAILRRLP